MRNIIGQANDRMTVHLFAKLRQVVCRVDGVQVHFAYAVDLEHAKLVAQEWQVALGYRWDGRIES